MFSLAKSGLLTIAIARLHRKVCLTAILTQICHHTFCTTTKKRRGMRFGVVGKGAELLRLEKQSCK